jgi:hypothetical protein
MSQNGKIPEELSILTDLYEDEADKSAIRHAFYDSATGDPNTQPVQFAILLSANAQLMKVYPGQLKKLMELETQKLATAIGAQLAIVKESADRILSAPQATSEHAQGIETANAEVKRLTEAVAMLEGQLKRIGEGINKLEAHCGNLDATLGTFAGIKKHQLWQLIAVSMGTGAILIIGFQLLLDWLRPILHI